MRRRRPPAGGRELVLAPELPADLRWARPAPAIASAQAHFAAAIESAGEAVLPDAVRARVTSVLAEWDGADPSLHDPWLERAESMLHPCSRPAARVALLSALAPYRIEEATVADFRRVWPAERDLVAAVAWGAFAAARRIGSWLVPSSCFAQAASDTRQGGDAQ
jgi:hypothetical protein